MKKDKGYVYVLDNPAHKPGLVKIGYTKRPLCERIPELSKDSGVPAPHEACYEACVYNAREYEKKVHRRLKSIRLNPNKEFFECSYEEAADAIKDEIGSNLLHEEYFKPRREEIEESIKRDREEKEKALRKAELKKEEDLRIAKQKEEGLRKAKQRETDEKWARWRENGRLNQQQGKDNPFWDLIISFFNFIFVYTRWFLVFFGGIILAHETGFLPFALIGLVIGAWLAYRDHWPLH